MRLFRDARFLGIGLAVALLGGVSSRGYAQASALPSAQTGPDAPAASDDPGKGRKLLDEMVTALGGEAWLNREDWIFEGRAATFYKGQPHEGAPQFQEYFRANPFGERVIIISHYGVFIATNT